VTGSTTSALTGSGLRVYFEGVKAVDDVDVVVHTGETLGLIGPNGAGKTTLLNALSGFQRPTAGTIALDGRDITHMAAAKRSRTGVVRTFQGIRIFRNLAAYENVELGGIGGGLHRTAARELASELLDEANFGQLAGRPAGQLSHGDQRLLGILRALAMRPTFLLLDEPAAGLNEAESRELISLLAAMPARRALGLLIVEHDMSVVMELSDRVQVMDYGRTIALGPPDEVRDDPAVQKAYLGTPVGAT
jgi:branched-chain amino acid transport system ATP-binding protein